MTNKKPTATEQIANWRKKFESKLSFPQAQRDGLHKNGYLFKDVEYAWQGYFRAMTEQEELIEKIKLEARSHAGEAKTANSTINEIYQIISNATGEPANWHGAQPVRDFVESMKTRLTVQNHRGKTFQAKFNIGDHVWYMHNNKPTEVIISAIKIFFVGTNQDRINYSAKNATHSVSWLDHTALPETLLYNSKIELLKTL